VPFYDPCLRDFAGLTQPVNFVSQKCCARKLAFLFLALERVDETFLHHSRVFASLSPASSWGGSQDFASHVGGGSVYDDDGPVVEGPGVRGSS